MLATITLKVIDIEAPTKPILTWTLRADLLIWMLCTDAVNQKEGEGGLEKKDGNFKGWG